MRPKATRSPLGSTTATFIAQPRLVASSTAALTSACARSIEIGVPKGILNGILSGMAFRSGGAGGAAGAGCCCAMAWPAANKPAASANTVKVRDFIWISSLIGGVFSAAVLILDEKKRPVPAKFGPTARDARCGIRVWPRGSKTIYQPCGQRNERAAQRAGIGISCRRLRGVVPGFAPRRACNHRGGDRRRRAASPQAVDVTCKAGRREGRRQKQRLKNERPGPEGAGPGPF